MICKGTFGRSTLEVLEVHLSWGFQLNTWERLSLLCLFLGCTLLIGTPYCRGGSVKLYSPEEVSGNFYVIKIEGIIAYPMDQQFTEALASREDSSIPVLLHLNSPGGAHSTGLSILKGIKKEQDEGAVFHTVVENGEKCASFCVYIYAQGTKRIAGAAAVFMFHGASPTFSNIPNREKTSEVLAYLFDSSISSEWLKNLQSLGVFSKPGKYWKSGRELMSESSNMVTQLLSHHSIEKPVEAPFDISIRSR